MQAAAHELPPASALAVDRQLTARATPWPQGWTCTCNGHPCCRHDHRAKQAPGWHVQGTGQPGHFTWALPSGRTYQSKPTSYPP